MLWLALAAAFISVTPVGTYHSYARAVAYNEVTGAPIEFRAEATYTILPPIVCVRCRDLYTQPLPPCPVRLAGTCRGRSAYGWFDVWDGYVDSDGVRHGVRCYQPGTDCRKYPLRSMLIVDGWTDRLGRIYVTSVRIAN